MILETLSALLHFQEADFVEEIVSALFKQSSGSLEKKEMICWEVLRMRIIIRIEVLKITCVVMTFLVWSWMKEGVKNWLEVRAETESFPLSFMAAYWAL